MLHYVIHFSTFHQDYTDKLDSLMKISCFNLWRMADFSFNIAYFIQKRSSKIISNVYQETRFFKIIEELYTWDTNYTKNKIYLAVLAEH